ncbi:hypothetical protein B0J14DRAFT_269491 [Halenospora varia]|nr:hypothetical protein B0J14DRAFT_269491 [Halenospora varia]
METVSNIASGVSKAIWREPEKTTTSDGATTGVTGNETVGKEPISGELGDVKAGEPYDKGNVEPAITATTTSGSTTDTKEPAFYSSTTSSNPLTMRPHESSSTTETPSTTSTAKHDSSLPTTSSTTAPTTTTGNTPATAPIHPEHETSKTGVTSIHSNSVASATGSAKPSSSNDTSGKGPTPSVGAAPTTSSTTSTKEGLEHQGASAPHDTPSSSEHQKIKETKAETETAAVEDTKKHEPLGEKSTSSGGSGGSGIPGVPGSEGLQKGSHGEGTGEKYVKSSGMTADGGDFDASQPGAGREADRLLEAKGIHREAPSKKEETTTTSGSSHDPVKETASTSSGSSDNGHAKKLSLVEKIKAKVHKH